MDTKPYPAFVPPTIIVAAALFIGLSFWANDARVAQKQEAEAHAQAVAALKAENAALRLLAAETLARVDEQERAYDTTGAHAVPPALAGYYGTKLDPWHKDDAVGANLYYDATPGDPADERFCATRGPDGRINDVRYAGHPGDSGYLPCQKL
mgnify:CR=1 FL=1